MATSLTRLPVEEKLRLVQDLWESIAADASAVPVDQKDLAEVQVRLAQYHVDGDRGVAVHEVADRIRREL